MSLSSIYLKNKLIENKNSKKNLITRNLFLSLKNDYIKNKIPLLTSFEKKYKFGYSNKLIKKLKKNKIYILVGMGGSILGAKAIYSFLKGKIKKKFIFHDNLSEKNASELNLFKSKKSTYIFISKSGNTIETIANLNLVIKKK